MAEHSPSSARIVALENLRVVAMLLGLVVHGVLPYTATGVDRFPIRDASKHVAADACYFAVHDFRMQLFFLLAGFAAAALADRRGLSGLVRNRLLRVAVPLLLAAAVVCPAMHLLFARHTATRGFYWNPDECGGWVGPNFHLWFLYYLLLCCAPLVLLLAVRHRIPGGLVRAVDAGVRRFVGWRWGTLVLAAVGIPVLWDMKTWWIDSPSGWVPDLTVWVYYLGFFLSGSLLYRHRDLLSGIGRRWVLQLAVANVFVLPAMLKLTISGNYTEEAVGNDPPAWLHAWKAAAIFLGGLYTWLTVGALLGLFQRHFAGGGKTWRYLADASYWCYLAGFPVQTALQVWLAPRQMPILAEFVIVNVMTFAFLLSTYELFVRHTWVGLLLNGKRPQRAAEPTPVVVLNRVSLAVPRCDHRPDGVGSESGSPPASGSGGSSSSSRRGSMARMSGPVWPAASGGSSSVS
jgi:hypothetical protein